MASPHFSSKLWSAVSSSPITHNNVKRMKAFVKTPMRNYLIETPIKRARSNKTAKQNVFIVTPIENNLSKRCLSAGGKLFLSQKKSPFTGRKKSSLFASPSLRAQTSKNVSPVPILNLHNLESSGTYLARGAFGVVKILSNADNRQFALKYARKTDNAFVGEQNALGLSHPNVIRVYQVKNIDPDTRLIIMEYGGPRNLQNMIDDAGTEWTPKLKVNILVQICKGLNYCHQNKLLHLDLKPLNIIVGISGHCKIADFGSSVKIPFKETLNIQSTPAYTAPELFRSQVVNVKCEIYSLGIIIWQLWTLAIPYKDLDKFSLIYQVVGMRLRPPIPDCKTNEEIKFKDLMVQCWDEVPDRRPELYFILQELSTLL